LTARCPCSRLLKGRELSYSGVGNKAASRRRLPLYAGAPLFRQQCAKRIRARLRGRVRTSLQKLICRPTRSICEGPSLSALKTNRFQRGAPAGQHRRRRQIVGKTNHLQADRRRCFYLAIQLPIQIRRLRTSGQPRTPSQTGYIATVPRLLSERSNRVIAMQRNCNCGV
jgi:hypothetical protein